MPGARFRMSGNKVAGNKKSDLFARIDRIAAVRSHIERTMLERHSSAWPTLSKLPVRFSKACIGSN